MSSSSRLRSRRAVAAALVVAATAGGAAWASTAGAATTLSVAAVIPDRDTVSMVLGVNPPPPLSQPGVFTVTAADGRPIDSEVRAVLGPQLSTGLVLDTSAAGASALQGGINGATNLLLQLPDGTRTAVVGDGGAKPSVLSPLTQGAVAAVSALNAARSGGDRHTADALAAALSGVPAGTGGSRLLLLYTGAPDAGGESAADLSRRLTSAGVMLAVVATGADQQYWSQVSSATGGVLVSARGTASIPPFDRVASLLRERFVLTFPRPSTLPATVRISMRSGTQTATESAVVPADTAGPAPPGPADSSGSGSTVPWWIVGAVLVLAVLGGAAYLARRQVHRPAPGPQPLPAVTMPPIGADEPAGAEEPLPRRVPANGTSVIAERAAAGTTDRPPAAPTGTTGTTGTGGIGGIPGIPGIDAAERAAAGPGTAEQAAAGRADAADAAGAATAAERAGAGSGAAGGRVEAEPETLPRRKPGASSGLRGHGPIAPRPAEAAPADPEQTMEIPRPRTAAGATVRPHPAADERAYSRLDEETAHVAAAVADGTMEFRHGVARIAMAAPGRVDLLDRVIEVERRLDGVQIGNSPPSKTVLDLLTAARRVVVGEVALVGPTGVRVEQASSVLRLIRPDRTTRECRTAKELARHVDLSTLSVDAPAS